MFKLPWSRLWKLNIYCASKNSPKKKRLKTFFSWKIVTSIILYLLGLSLNLVQLDLMLLNTRNFRENPLLSLDSSRSIVETACKISLMSPAKPVTLRIHQNTPFSWKLGMERQLEMIVIWVETFDWAQTEAQETSTDSRLLEGRFVSSI